MSLLEALICCTMGNNRAAMQSLLMKKITILCLSKSIKNQLVTFDSLNHKTLSIHFWPSVHQHCRRGCRQNCNRSCRQCHDAGQAHCRLRHVSPTCNVSILWHVIAPHCCMPLCAISTPLHVLPLVVLQNRVTDGVTEAL